MVRGRCGVHGGRGNVSVENVFEEWKRKDVGLAVSGGGVLD